MTLQHSDFAWTIHSKVQDFKFPRQEYDCLFGCWTFCYLNCEDRKQLKANIQGTLKDAGIYIMIEPVLGENQKQVAKFHDIKEQQLVVRGRDWYDDFFDQSNWGRVDKFYIPKKEQLSEDLVAIVWQKEIYA